MWQKQSRQTKLREISQRTKTAGELHFRLSFVDGFACATKDEIQQPTGYKKPSYIVKADLKSMFNLNGHLLSYRITKPWELGLDQQ